MARNNFGGNFFTLLLVVMAVCLVFLATRQSLQYDLPRLTRFGTEEERMLASFPSFLPKGEYICFPTFGKHIYFQSREGKKEICHRGEIITVRKELETYVWYR